MALKIDAGLLATCALASSLAAGCSHLPPLDDAKLTSVSLISSDGLPGPKKPRWPAVRVSFQSTHISFDPDHIAPNVQFDLCDVEGEDRRLYGFGWAKVVPSDALATLQWSEKTETDGLPPEYEIVFSYVFWDRAQRSRQRDTIVLLPLPNDLCVAFVEFNKPFPPRVGRPLRISKEIINDVVAPLPRPVPPPS